MRAESDKRNGDEKMSNEVHQLLEREFYKALTSNYEDVKDKNRQIKGIDTIFDFKNFHYLCDEKSAVRWRNLKTYTLEISFLDKGGNIMEGWLINDKLYTNSYMLIWVEENYVEYALIKKDTIMNKLLSLGWTKELLKKKAKKIRENSNEPKGDLRINGCCFKFSNNLVEKPVNIQLPKEAYILIADYHGIINTEQFKGRKNEK